jgi:hypothetical protein
MMSHRTATHQKVLTLFLATVLVVAGLIAGMRFASGNDAPSDDAPILVEEARDIDVSGEWVGTTTQDYNDNLRYEYRVVLEQEGHVITGISYFDMLHERDVHSEERIEGFVDGNVVFLQEQENLVLVNAELDNWCLTEVTLTYQVVNGQEMLVGDWTVASWERELCDGIAGRTILTRQPE